MCSIVSTDSTRSNGVEVFVVDRRGKGRFKPQSPLESEDGGVVIVRWVGYGRVAVSELNVTVEDRSPIGRGRGAGIENNREALKRAPPGDTLRVAMAVEMPNSLMWMIIVYTSRQDLSEQFPRKLPLSNDDGAHQSSSLRLVG